MRIDPDHISWERWLQKWFGLIFLAALLVNAGGLWVGIMEPDGALYASIAKTIARSGDFINLRAEGRDWLDKPHFPFWMAALSFRVFGINSFGYKFPALLFWGAGGMYTYRLARSLYDRPVAQLSLLIYVSAAHLVVSNNDVRAEPYLTGLVIGSVYHFYQASRSRPGFHLVAGSLLAACAMMTKGPFVLVTICSGFIVDWVVRKDWQQFRNTRWWIALVLIAVFILPELYCVYTQFDLHPEKTVFGRTGVSGIRWFFWDSQFGRFFNNGPIRGSGDPFFYFHTLLWAFLPWSLLLYAAVFADCRHYWRVWRGGADTAYGSARRMTIPGGAIAWGASLAGFLMFSLSRFQLPHYLNILFPFFAILTAAWLYGLRSRSVLRIAGAIQYAIAGILALLLPAICWWFHAPNYGFVLAALILLSGSSILLFRGREVARERNAAENGDKDHGLKAAVGRSCWMAIVTYGFINFGLYPAMMHYQAGTTAGKYIGEQGITGTVYMIREAPPDFSFEFYCPAPIRWIAMDSLGGGRLRPEGMLLFLPTVYSDSLIRRGYRVEELRRFPDFHISAVTGEFLNYRTRGSALNWFSVFRIRSKGMDGLRMGNDQPQCAGKMILRPELASDVR